MIDRMEIEITKQDIAIGKPGCPWDCAGAVAIWRAAKKAGMHVEDVRAVDGVANVYCAFVGRVAFRIPDSLKDFIQAFDAGLPVEPGKHVLELIKD